jgi:hypothetical protein
MPIEINCFKEDAGQYDFGWLDEWLLTGRVGVSDITLLGWARNPVGPGPAKWKGGMFAMPPTS